jgi:hypothetical protein
MKKSILLLLFVVVFVSSCSLLKKQPKEEPFDNFDTEVRTTFYVNRPVVEDTTLYTLVYYKYGNDTIHIYEKNNSIPKDTKYFKVIRVENNVKSRHWP